MTFQHQKYPLNGSDRGTDRGGTVKGLDASAHKFSIAENRVSSRGTTAQAIGSGSSLRSDLKLRCSEQFQQRVVIEGLSTLPWFRSFSDDDLSPVFCIGAWPISALGGMMSWL